MKVKQNLGQFYTTNYEYILQNLKIPIIGVIPKNPSANLESRHLGLIPVREQKDLHNKIKQISIVAMQFHC